MIVDPKYETIDAPWFVDFHNLDDLLPNQRGILTKITRNWWMHVLRSASSRLALSSTSESRPYYWPRYWAWWLRSYTKCVCVCVCVPIALLFLRKIMHMLVNMEMERMMSLKLHLQVITKEGNLSCLVHQRQLPRKLETGMRLARSWSFCAALPRIVMSRTRLGRVNGRKSADFPTVADRGRLRRRCWGRRPRRLQRGRRCACDWQVA